MNCQVAPVTAVKFRASVALRDGRKPTDMDLPFTQKLVLDKVIQAVKDTDIEKLLKEYRAI